MASKHEFGRRYNANYSKKLRCSSCNEPKSHDELNSDGFKYICDSCQGDEE